MIELVVSSRDPPDLKMEFIKKTVGVSGGIQNIETLFFCVKGVPGFSYAISRKTALARCEGNCRSLSLDLFDQDKNMEKTKQFR